ncbi:STAS domain-containing protein [Mycobacterium sp. Y57]|uniref:SulP family inorganic anion transporter n=1 Tax=Mycolicibacterium xanthum TaxID=2796469 RepID=UPI001C842EB8|nr:SulP family inorganic anion transporter [Mycolicibacterium xanthum]MBX7433219.1 STAS domain-containing protein [Mycolicibacterium xanthum]
MKHLLPGLTRGNLAREVMAGITLLAIAVPLNIGYAQIAGLPPTAGLYALVVPAVVFAVLASSRQVVAAPDAAAAALVGSSVAGLAAAGSQQYAAMAAAQAVVGGLLFFAFAFFKLGFLADFLSKPILIGFVGGLALEILLSQLAKMLGIKVGSRVEFFEKIVEIITRLGELSWWSVGVSLGALAVLLLGRRVLPAAPWALVVLVVATIASVALALRDKGVSVLGDVPAGAPVLRWPDLSLTEWISITPAAIALTMITVAEGLLVARSYADKNGYSVDANRDLAAFGAANVAAGLSSSFTVGSSTSRTAAVDQAGSRTQLPSLVMATGALLLLLFGTALLADIPSPAIGAIVAVAVLKLLGVAEFRELWHQSRFEFAVGASCFLGVLLVGPLGGIIIAFGLSVVNLLRRAAAPAIDILEGTDDPSVSLTGLTPHNLETVPGVIVLRFAAPIFFGNGSVLHQTVCDAVDAAPHPVHAFVLDLEGVSGIDITGGDAVRKTQAWLRDRSVTFAYSRVRPELRDSLERLDLLEGALEFDTNRAAVAALRRP